MSAEQENIKDLAYRLWQDAGSPHGRDQEFWFAAEAQVSTAVTAAPQPAKAKAATTAPAPKAPAAKAKPAAAPKATKPASKPKAASKAKTTAKV